MAQLPPGSYDDHGSMILGSVIGLLVITVLTVLLRCWVRLKVTPGWGWDDTSIIIALVSVSYVPYGSLQSNIGIGSRHRGQCDACSIRQGRQRQAYLDDTSLSNSRSHQMESPLRHSPLHCYTLHQNFHRFFHFAARRETGNPQENENDSLRNHSCHDNCDHHPCRFVVDSLFAGAKGLESRPTRHLLSSTRHPFSRLRSVRLCHRIRPSTYHIAHLHLLDSTD